MKSGLYAFSILVSILVYSISANAQLTNWQYVSTVDITETRGDADSNYQVLLNINTQDLIAQGKLNNNGSDLRFAFDCEGNNLIDYYIETPTALLPVSTSAKVWVRMPYLLSYTTTTIYMFSGNVAASVSSNQGATFPNTLVISVPTNLTGNIEYDWFQINAGVTVGVLNGVPLEITADRIVIEGTLNGRGSGFAGGTVGFEDGFGPGAGTTTADLTAGAGGGAYGGDGGDGGYDSGDTAGVGGTAYGVNATQAIQMGSGGGGTGSADGGAGGGSITFISSDVTIPAGGSVNVNGADAIPQSGVAIPWGGGAGSGGGFMLFAESIDVSGAITTNGGNGSEGSAISNDGGGGGGGGRIKLFYYQNATLAGPIIANGGLGGQRGDVAFAEDGANGSIYNEQLTGGLQTQVGSPIARVAPAISGADTVCVNSTESYFEAASGANLYFWYTAGGTIMSGQGSNNISVQWTSIGLQQLAVIAANVITGCSDTAFYGVFVDNNIPVANFGWSAACDGEPLLFIDSSTVGGGLNITSWNWSFGDGANSTDVNPVHIYVNPGPYNVNLTVTSEMGCENSISQNLTVDPLPTASFTTTNGCLGNPTIFTNSSVGATSYLWDFGNGVTSTLLNPLPYTYPAPGAYTVTLTSFTNNGCEDVFQSNVTIYPNPVADFDFISACPTDLVQFNNLSSISSGVLSYNWDFGDGSGSLAESPLYAYTVEGNYTVTLTTTSNFSCIDVISKVVTVYPVPVVAFVSDSVCDGNPINFDNETTIASGTIAYTWAFGDGNFSNNVEPSHTYASTGNYNVTLTAVSDKGCTDIGGEVAIVYLQPSASFTASNVCDGDSVSFTNTSTSGGGITYSWSFGDGNFSTATNPTYLYATSGIYSVVLAVNTSDGCTDTTTNLVTVYPEPVAAFSASNVCDGTPVSFTNNSTISIGTLNYNWNFGDGNTSTTPNPNYTYASAGVYTVSLIVNSNLGCTDSTGLVIEVYEQPTASFSAANVCDGDSVIFTNNSISSDSSSYIWNFGDGGSSTDSLPIYLYSTYGTYNVTLIVTTPNGCVDSATNTIDVFAEPIAGFTAADVCLGVPNVFTSTSSIPLGTINHLWSFGDGDTSTSINPTHKYDTSGIFTVTLIVYSNNGCTDIQFQTVVVYPNPFADFSVGSACYQKDVVFSNLSTIDFGTISYNWDFDDGNFSTDTNPIHQYTGLGTYDVALTVTSDQGCVDDTIIDLTINPNPIANFFSLPLCADDTTQFNNLSFVASGNLNFNWDFDDGNNSIERGPKHFYGTGGDYNVELIANSDFGCADTITKTIEVYYLPEVTFAANDVCFGEPVFFNNTSTIVRGTIIETVWDYGNTETAIKDDNYYLYESAGAYQVVLAAISNKGCTNSFTDGVVVNVLPDSTIRAFGPTEFCPGESVELEAPSGNYNYVWSTVETTQGIIVNQTGTYIVTVTNQFGCKGDDSIDVFVFALPNITAEKDTTISKGYSAQLLATGGVYYLWDPAATLNFGHVSDPVATPIESTIYTVTGTDDNGCVNTAQVTVTLDEDFLVQPTNLITPNGDGKNDTWYITNILTYPTSKIQIFDRWGSLVFTSDGYSNEWNGQKHSVDLPTGTYYYTITFENSNKIYKGAVSILR